MKELFRVWNESTELYETGEVQISNIGHVYGEQGLITMSDDCVEYGSGIEDINGSQIFDMDMLIDQDGCIYVVVCKFNQVPYMLSKNRTKYDLEVSTIVMKLKRIGTAHDRLVCNLFMKGE